MGKKIDMKHLSADRWAGILEILIILILAVYPLRHISWGLDLWDTGYNYANFQYMGTEHMDPMWLFSTYLANVVGNLFTKLPGADMLLGMNFYTGLFVSLLALMGYFFCTRRLNMPKGLVFLGEMAAISLCWCPTALLYNYLTYVLFLGSSILLYCGLTQEKRSCLIWAGVLLGSNVLVRFSNLPEAAMIVTVWAYDVIVWLETRKEQKPFWPRLIRHTLWCLLGYVAALVVLLGYIHIRYGLDEYIAGIVRLFAMTDNATDYKATSMIMGMVETYVENLFWVIRIGVIVAGGLAGFAVSGWLEALLLRLADKGQREKNNAMRLIGTILQKIISVGTKIFWIAVSAAMLVWMYHNKFASMLFYSYDSMLRPGVLFLMLTMLIAVIRIFHKNSPKEEKLVSGMLILIILLTSLGSNNKVYPSLNNLFVAAPYTLWESWRFVRNVKEKKAFPVKCILVAFLALCLFHFGAFGATFVFAEGTGVQDVSGSVDNNDILQNIKMPAEKAQWITELSDYVNENELAGKEVILYGGVPSLSYYLQMPSAFNPWSDLRSYSLETMKQDIDQVGGMISEKGEEKPVIIVENTYVLYYEGGLDALAAAEIDEKKQAETDADEKWKLLVDFMEDYGYEQAFSNEKFTVYR